MQEVGQLAPTYSFALHNSPWNTGLRTSSVCTFIFPAETKMHRNATGQSFVLMNVQL